MTKRAPKEQLLAAVERALEHDRQQRQHRARLDQLRRRFAELSGREMEVLGHVVQGKMNKQIAAELGINMRTVKLHRTNLTRKLEVKSVAELTLLVHEAGLAGPPKPAAEPPRDCRGFSPGGKIPSPRGSCWDVPV